MTCMCVLWRSKLSWPGTTCRNAQRARTLSLNESDGSLRRVSGHCGCGLAQSGMLTREQRRRAVPQLLKMTDDMTLDDATHGWVFQALRDITGASIAADSAAWRSWWSQHRS